MSVAYLFLLGAIVAEVIGSLATRFSDGFTKPLPVAIAVVGVVGAYYMLSLALKHGLGIGVAYGIWAAIGIGALATIGVLFLGDGLTWTQGGGLALIVGGVLALEMGASH